MQYPGIVVANEIIKLANAQKKGITPMKLQKILYLANGISYKRNGEKLIEERFEPWEYGPVLRSVYNVYKQCKGNNITELIDENIPNDSGNGFALSSSYNVKDNDLMIINEAWNNAKNLDAFTLSAWSHNKNSPWDKAYNANPKQPYINDEDIKEYFDAFIKN